MSTTSGPQPWKSQFLTWLPEWFVGFGGRDSASRWQICDFLTQYDCHRPMFWTRSMEWILSCCGPVVRLMALYTRWYSSLPCCRGKYSAISGSLTSSQYLGMASASLPAPMAFCISFSWSAVGISETFSGNQPDDSDTPSAPYLFRSAPSSLLAFNTTLP